MAQATYKKELTGRRSLRQTMAHGIRALGGANVPNYTLLYLNDSKNKKKGDFQTIVVPYVEVGRGGSCVIQYSDAYPTIHRKHAAILWDKGQVTLKHLGNNPLMVNNYLVNGQQILQNGDEIQFSTNGPKVRFNIAAQKIGETRFTDRVVMFTQQALKPYKKAVTALSLLILGTIGFAINNTLEFNKAQAIHDDKLKGIHENLVEKEASLNDVLADLNDKKEDLKKLNLSDKERKRQLRALKNSKNQLLAQINDLEEKFNDRQDQIQQQPQIITDINETKIEDNKQKTVKPKNSGTTQDNNTPSTPTPTLVSDAPTTLTTQQEYIGSSEHQDIKELLDYVSSNPNDKSIDSGIEVINDYVKKHVVITQSDFFVTEGDALDMNQKYMQSQSDMFSVQANQNIMILAAVKNNSPLRLPIKVTGVLNLLSVTTALFLKEVRRNPMKTANLFYLEPGQEVVYMGTNKVKGGFGTIMASGYYKIDESEPYNVYTSIYTQEITQERMDTDRKALERFLNTGNVGNKKGFEETLNDFFGLGTTHTELNVYYKYDVPDGGVDVNFILYKDGQEYGEVEASEGTIGLTGNFSNMPSGSYTVSIFGQSYPITINSGQVTQCFIRDGVQEVKYERY